MLKSESSRNKTRWFIFPCRASLRVKSYPSNTLAAPLPTPGEIKENEDYWKRLDDENLQRLVQTVKQSTEIKRLTQANSIPLLVGAFYARALDYWGVELQRSGRNESAGKYFARALEFNPENPCAFINLEFNRHLLAGGQGKRATGGVTEYF